MAKAILKEIECLLETNYHIKVKIEEADDDLRYHILGKYL